MRIIAKPKDFPYYSIAVPLDQLMDTADRRLTPGKHRRCPGHAAVIDTDGTPISYASTRATTTTRRKPPSAADARLRHRLRRGQPRTRRPALGYNPDLAAHWLTVVAELGYPLTDAEQQVATSARRQAEENAVADTATKESDAESEADTT